MKRIAIIIGILVIFGASGKCEAQAESGSCSRLLAEGNDAYKAENYEQALAFYDSIVEKGMESAALYYNMGNTYYKMKQFPRAILYYEKALKLDPSNEDIKTNLEIANLAIVDKIKEIPQSYVAKKWNGLKSSLSADGWARVSIVFFTLLLICLFAFLMSRRTGLRKAGFFAGLLMVVFLALSVFFAIKQQQELKQKDEAIIMTPTVMVKSAPSKYSVDLFPLHEGAKVSILDTEKVVVDSVEEDWNRIRIADGSDGWLPSESMVAF